MTAEVKTQTRADWLAQRLKGIGGSDAAPALGLSRYKSPLALYLEKIGEVADEREPSEAVEWGVLLEPVIVKRYEEVTKRKTSEYYPMRAEGIPEFVIGNPDRVVVNMGELPDSKHLYLSPGILEVKATGARMSKDWEEEPPLEAQVQAQHYLALTGLSWCSLVALIGGQRLAYQDIPRNDKFIEIMLEREADFWRMVEKRTPPRVSSALDLGVLKKLYPKEVSGKIVKLPPEAVEIAAVRETAKAAMKSAEILADKATAELQQLMGDAETGILPDMSGKYTWKNVHRAAHEVAESDYRMMRRAKL